jgi:hypothetical protein
MAAEGTRTVGEMPVHELYRLMALAVLLGRVPIETQLTVLEIRRVIPQAGALGEELERLLGESR